MMRRRLLIVVGILVALVVGWLLIPDADLSDEARAWIDESEPQVAKDQNLFFAVIGFQVAEGADPIAEGVRLTGQFNETLAALADGGTGGSLELDPYWESPPLEPSDAIDTLCRPACGQEPCLEKTKEQSDQVETLVDQNRVLLERYDRMAALPHYRATMTLDIRTPIPRISALLAIHRLRLAELTLKVLNGDGDAIGALSRDRIFTRRFASVADNLLVKMVALAMVRQNLMTTAELLDAIDPSAIEPIAPLSDAERSLRACYRSEFLLNANLCRQLNQNPQMLDEEEGTHSSPWLTSYLFAPNHSINLTAELMHDLADASELSGPELNAAWESLERSPDDYLSWTDYVRSPVGSILFSIAVPSGGRMMTRVHDIDGLIALVNLKRALRSEEVGDADLEAFIQKSAHVDPYKHEPMVWDEEQRLLSFVSLSGEEVSVSLSE